MDLSDSMSLYDMLGVVLLCLPTGVGAKASQVPTNHTTPKHRGNEHQCRYELYNCSCL